MIVPPPKFFRCLCKIRKSSKNWGRFGPQIKSLYENERENDSDAVIVDSAIKNQKNIPKKMKNGIQKYQKYIWWFSCKSEKVAKTRSDLIARQNRSTKMIGRTIRTQPDHFHQSKINKTIQKIEKSIEKYIEKIYHVFLANQKKQAKKWSDLNAR